MKNILSFDLEYWYDSEFIKEKNNKDMLKEGLNIVLNLLRKYKVKSTFFVTGNVIENYPKEILNIKKEGHEIASHGYSHKRVSKMSKKEFKKEIDKSIKLIRKCTGKSPKGFRAPCFSITKKEFWIYKILNKKGIIYSSSTFPINMGLYGDKNLPDFKTINSKVVEYPILPYKIFNIINFPFSGGIYFRILPISTINYFIRKLNKKGKQVIIYLHPWEFCKNLPKVKTNVIGKITTYFGLKNTENKFEKLLRSFEFVRFEEALSSKSL